MIQGGGFTKEMGRKNTLPSIPNEATNGVSNKRGTLAMARSGDPNSATAQFFINVADNKGLDYKGPNDFGYCVFGEVKSGMGIVNRIEEVETTKKGGYENVPVSPVVIRNVRIKE
jgi:cyclophilin family peptidyl-prolyl cis-trans isomerase